MADQMIKRSAFLEYMTAFEERLEIRFDKLTDGLGSLENRMEVQFEETRGLIRLSLEGLDALRETTERGFADVRRDNLESRTLLEEAVRHVRRRVERVENTPPAKRSR